MAIQSNFPATKPSLLLDFANTKQLDPRITFTRATTATYYDGVTTAKAEENLLLYSQNFSVGNWFKSGNAVTSNSTTAPDGTSTGTLSTASAFTGVTEISATLSAGVIPNSSACTFSAYFKAGTKSAVTLSYSSSTDYVVAVYDLTGVTVSQTGTGGSGAITSTSITSVGNSWYRCSISFTLGSSGSATNVPFIGMAPATTGNTFGAYGRISGTYAGTETIYIWGAQVEQRSSVTAYTATTTAPITNYIPVLQTAASGVARFDNNPTTGESLGLLIEEARTNLLTYSDDFTNASWLKTDATITSNTIVAPDGTLTGDKLVESTTANVAHQVYKGTTLTATSYTFSFYAKAAERTWCSVYFDSSFSAAYVNLSNGTLGTVPAGYTIVVTSVGNGWYRIAATRTGTAATWYTVIETATGDGGRNYTGNGFSGIYIWGAQLEAGAFATSYIPTVASTVTRSADSASMTGTNFSSWFNAGEGTIYSDSYCRGIGSAAPRILEIANNAANTFAFMQTGTPAYVYVNDVNQVSFSGGNASIGSSVYAMAYAANNFGCSVGGATAQSDTSGVLPPAAIRMDIGASIYYSPRQLNGTIKKIAYYPIRVTNTQLQALTS